MNRPRLFLSAVSEELRTARQAVAATVRKLGFDPVSQDDLLTGHGELRQWLREQLDSCEGLIQLVGQGYGAEPPEVDPEYGRVSYTQFEFLYASRQQNKKIWVIVIGKDFTCDKASDQLDLPRDTGLSDPGGYQTERRILQENYLTRLKQANHLRHTANDSTELENIILLLRDDLSELRRQWDEWLQKDASFKTHTADRLTELVEANRLTTEKIRAHLLQTAAETHRRELAEAEADTDWRRRQHLREAAENAHIVRLSRIDELVTSIAESEGRGTGTSVFQEMTRILKEQGVDDAISYVHTKHSKIFEKIRSRAARARERNRADLQPLLKAAALYQTKGQADEARKLYREVRAIEPDWPEALHAIFWFLVNQGDIALIRTTLTEARQDYEEAHHIAKNSNGTAWQRNLSVTYDRLGDVAVQQGQLKKAGRIYRDSLAIAKALVEKDLNNLKWQHDLSISYIKLGNVAVDEGQLTEAAQVYEQGLKIAKKLAESDHGNTQWQCDLCLFYDKLGKLALDQGHLAEAAEFYGQGLLIAKKRVAGNFENTQWQRDLAVFYDRLADVAEKQKHLTEAAYLYDESLVIRETLVKRNPNNTQWQRDLSVSYDKLGDVAVAHSQLEEATRVYGEGLKIAQHLARMDLSNIQWQCDLAESYCKLADLAERQKNSKGARAYWEQAFDVLAGIEKRGLHLSPKDRRSLKGLRGKLGK